MSKINRTRWRPDTCDCVLEFEWDDDAPGEQRVHRPVLAVPCRFHQPDPTGRVDPHVHVHNTVLEENQRKNRVVAALEKAGQDVADISWRYDDRRVLKVSGPGLKTARLSLGPKVEIE